MLINVPGVKKENITLSLEEGYLTVEIKEEETKEDNYIVRERIYGVASRKYFLGKEYEKEDINAALADGVLTLSFPKEKEVKTKEDKYITIK